jgi:(+)-trans-carveol dehydrogenase
LLAREGADIIALDIAAQTVDSLLYALGTEEDLATTVKLVEAAGGKCMAAKVDVRDQGALDAAVSDGLARFGHIDVVVINHGISARYDSSWNVTEDEWGDIVDVNLTGVWHVVKATVPAMIGAEQGGSIIMTSSSAGLIGLPGMLGYVTTKSGMVGMMRSLANELAPYSIRVNSVHPGSVRTPMILNDYHFKQFRPDLDNATFEDVKEVLAVSHPLPIPVLEPIDISNAVLFLASDEAQCITGVALPVDAGMANQAGRRMQASAQRLAGK